MEKYWYPALMEWTFNFPPPFNVPDPFERLVGNPDAGIDPIWFSMSGAQLYKDLFESKEAQTLFSRGMQAAGISPEQYGTGFATLIFVFICTFGCGVALGGNHQVAHACQKVIMENGGKIFTRSPVSKILIENGRAKGVRLVDGREIEAKKLVLSGVDPHQLCLDLIDKEHLSEKIIRRIKNIERSWITITWYT